MVKPTSSAASAANSRRGQRTIRSLMEFLRFQARLEANKPTFGQFLGLSVSGNDADETNKEDYFSTVREDRFWFLDASPSNSIVRSGERRRQEQSLVFRYRFPRNRLQGLHKGTRKTSISESGMNCGPVGLSTYTSILDEVTSFSIISATGPSYPRPGVSVTMQSQWGPAYDATSSLSFLEEVDIVTTITKKGRNLAFVRAEVRDPSNYDGIICYFDHVKYLTVGWGMGLLLTPVGMWFLNLYSRYILPYLYRRKQRNHSNNNNIESNRHTIHSDILDSFLLTSDTTATFQFGPPHTNGFGGLHGGVQAILMERLGELVARRELLKVLQSTTNSGADDVGGAAKISCTSNSGDWMEAECQRLVISYQSSASRVLELEAHIINPPRLDHPSVTLRIEILRGNGQPQANNQSSSSNNESINSIGNRGSQKPTSTEFKRVVVSEGILTFVSTSPKTKVQ